MSMEELVAQIKGNPALAQEFENATDSGTIADFLKAKGCSASEAEFTSYIAEHS